MKQYNESAAKGEDLCFYGADMQRISYSFQFLNEACKELGVDTTILQKLIDGQNWSSEYDNLNRIEIINQVFYSYDPLAKASKMAGLDMCWLDFDEIPENCELHELIYQYIYMGNLGEGYSWIMRLIPPSYRMFQPPAVLYNSMILVADAHPTKIITEK